ncbi:MAG: CcmD family protein [Dehalococcoidia bacterium]
MRRWRLGFVAVPALAALLMPQPAMGLESSAAAMPRAAVSGASLERPEQPPAQDEFVPVSELPREEQLPAAPFLIAAYAIAWLVVIVYVWRLWRRLSRVERELREALRAK